MWMLDTDIASFILRDRPTTVRERFESQSPSQIALSSIVLAELLFGAARHPNPDAIRNRVRLLVSGLSLLPWGRSAAEHFADIRFHLESKGTPLAAQDLMIAAHARSLGAVLVTNNLKHFRRVSGLKLENWL